MWPHGGQLSCFTIALFYGDVVGHEGCFRLTRLVMRSHVAVRIEYPAKKVF